MQHRVQGHGEKMEMQAPQASELQGEIEGLLHEVGSLRRGHDQ